MGSLLKKLKKINSDATIMSEDKNSEISGYISTGSYSFDGILSGKLLDGGIPNGRVTSIIGESSSGKSLVAGMICANAQKKKRDIIWHDSEKANSGTFMERAGCDLSKVGHSEVYTVEEYRNQLFKLLKAAGEETNPKYLFVLDSLGNLTTEKELKDADTDNNASDMGLRAKWIKSLTRVITGPLAKLDIPLLILNHGYQNPSNPMQKKLNVSGGLGIKYISTIMAEMTKSKEYNEKLKLTTGNVFTMTTTKNRLIPEDKKAQVLIDYDKGVNPYFGLLPYAVEFGFIKKISAQKYEAKHIGGKEFKKGGVYVPEVWEPIMKDLDKLYQEKYKFSSINLEEDDNVELLQE